MPWWPVAFQEDFATPLQFEDYRLDAQRRARRPAASQHSAYHFYLSTRDMARLGLLMLREGRWGNTRLLTAEWVEEMITPVTPVGEMNPEGATTVTRPQFLGVLERLAAARCR